MTFRLKPYEIGWKHKSINSPIKFSFFFGVFIHIQIIYIKRGRGFELNEIQRILEIIATNSIRSEEEISRLSLLMNKANITSDRYQQLMNSVNISKLNL